MKLQKNRTVFSVASSVLMVGGALASATIAHADSSAVNAANQGLNVVAGGLAGIFGPAIVAPTEVCGESNVVPFVFANFTATPQTGSFTIGGDLNEQVRIVPAGSQDQNCPTRDGSGLFDQTTPTLSENFTVQPFSALTYWVTMGGVDEGMNFTPWDFSIGGAPNGTPNAQWYDFRLNVNPDSSFTSLQPYYEGTGGSGGVQNGFNILSCNPTIGQPEILSPYDSVASYPPAYGSGDPVCMGWIGSTMDVMASTTLSTAGGPIVGLEAAGSNALMTGGTAEFLLEMNDTPMGDGALMANGVQLASGKGNASPSYYVLNGGAPLTNGNYLVGVYNVPVYNSTIIQAGASSVTYFENGAPQAPDTQGCSSSNCSMSVGVPNDYTDVVSIQWSPPVFSNDGSQAVFDLLATTVATPPGGQYLYLLPQNTAKPVVLIGGSMSAGATVSLLGSNGAPAYGEQYWELQFIYAPGGLNISGAEAAATYPVVATAYVDFTLSPA